jgi:lipid A 3-O-deacylase
VGPSLQFKRRNFPIELDFGSSPTYVSTHEWGAVDVGTQLQFSSHAGLDWDITRRLRVGYRFTHMSNAGIKEPNPGINMHMLSVSVLF